jgi:hypothetical protein
MGMVLQWAREYNIRIERKRRKPQKEKRGNKRKRDSVAAVMSPLLLLRSYSVHSSAVQCSAIGTTLIIHDHQRAVGSFIASTLSSVLSISNRLSDKVNEQNQNY